MIDSTFDLVLLPWNHKGMHMCNESRTWTVYTLSDPRKPDDVRYVGVTHGTPQQRLARHISSARKKVLPYHSSKWIRSLLNEGALPHMRILEQGLGEGWEAETLWVRHYREAGASLTNHADGGHGPLGCVRSPETREKISAANRGKKQSPDLVEKRVAPLRGRPITQDAKDKVSAGNKGKRRSLEVKTAMSEARATPEWRLRVSEANKVTYARRKAAGLVKSLKGRKASEETRKKLSLARMGKVQSEETKARRSASLKIAWARRKAEGGG